MTINLKYNTSVQVTLWLNLPISNTYLLLCKNKTTKEVTSTILDNISNNLNQFALFNIVAVDTELTIPSNNVIYLSNKGEYDYNILIDLTPEENLIVGFGNIINEYSESSLIEYSNETKNITYGK